MTGARASRHVVFGAGAIGPALVESLRRRGRNHPYEVGIAHTLRSCR